MKKSNHLKLELVCTHLLHKINLHVGDHMTRLIELLHVCNQLKHMGGVLYGPQLDFRNYIDPLHSQKGVN